MMRSFHKKQSQWFVDVMVNNLVLYAKNKKFTFSLKKTVTGLKWVISCEKIMNLFVFVSSIYNFKYSPSTT